MLLLALTSFLSISRGAFAEEPPATKAVTKEVPLFVDFLQYRSAATALVTGQNPYDPAVIAALEYQEFPNLPEAVLQWNPPLLFPFTLPFAGVSFGLGSLLWASLLVALLAWSAQRLLHYQCFLNQERQLSRSWSQKVTFVLGLFLFFPLWECFRYGQVSPLLLAGFTGFLLLRLQGKESFSSRYAAGLCLSLTLIKPHLLYLLYLGLSFEALRKRRYGELLGFISGAFVLGGIPLFWRPSIWQDYFFALQSMPLYFQTPTLGSLLQSLDPTAQWIRFLPMFAVGAGSIPFLFVYSRKAISQEVYLFLAALSLFTSPYGWIYDLVLLLPLVVALLSSHFSHRKLVAAYLALSALGFPWYGTIEIQEYWWYSLGLVMLGWFYARSSSPAFAESSASAR
jgi:hypothetical protein